MAGTRRGESGEKLDGARGRGLYNIPDGKRKPARQCGEVPDEFRPAWRLGPWGLAALPA